MLIGTESPGGTHSKGFESGQSQAVGRSFSCTRTISGIWSGDPFTANAFSVQFSHPFGEKQSCRRQLRSEPESTHAVTRITWSPIFKVTGTFHLWEIWKDLTAVWSKNQRVPYIPLFRSWSSLCRLWIWQVLGWMAPGRLELLSSLKAPRQ